MEYLQYIYFYYFDSILLVVLNLVISGIPSILVGGIAQEVVQGLGFKPCYKWNTFNTNSLLGINTNIRDMF